MKGSSHLATAVISALVGAIAATGTVALAGTGVGGIFNLGVTNTVDATSKLNGTATNSMLDVSNAGVDANSNGIVGRSASPLAPALAGVNSGGGTGLRGSSTSGAGLYGQSTSGLGVRAITAGSQPALKATNTATGPGAAFEAGGSAAPFTVNSSTLVANLNADMLGGLHESDFLKPSSVAAGDVTGPYTDLQLGPNSVGSAEIATDAVNATEIADNSIDAGEIVDFGLTNQDVGVLFAQVNADGTIANSSGGVTGIHIGAGTYEVDFGRTMTSCAFVMTQGEAGVGGAGGGITGVTDRSGNAEAVFATMRTNANVLADRAFQLVAVC